MGPLYGLSGITSLEAGNGTAYAVDAGGAKHDLLPLVQSVESGFSAILSGAWEANRDGDAFRLRFGEDGACTLEVARQGSRVTSTRRAYRARHGRRRPPLRLLSDAAGWQ